MVIFETGFRYFTVLHRFADGAARIVVMFTVAVFASAYIVMEFDKSVKDLFRLEMPETKFTHTRESITSPPCGK